MNWKTSIQVRDLDSSQKLEATCKVCGHMHYLTRASIICSLEREFLYLDEVEAETVCKARGCHGRVRLAMVHMGGTSGFIGGLA